MQKVNHSRSLAKAITWRVTGTVDTFLLSMLITRQIKFALAISGTEVVTKVILYYFHERICERVGWGKQEVAKD